MTSHLPVCSVDTARLVCRNVLALLNFDDGDAKATNVSLTYDNGDGQRDDEGDDDDDEVDRVEPPLPAEEDGRRDGVDARDDLDHEVGRQDLEMDVTLNVCSTVVVRTPRYKEVMGLNRGKVGLFLYLYHPIRNSLKGPGHLIFSQIFRGSNSLVDHQT